MYYSFVIMQGFTHTHVYDIRNFFTVGLTKPIKQLADDAEPFNLAISLHAPSDEKRDKIMPINASMNLDSLEEAVRYYYRKTERPSPTNIYFLMDLMIPKKMQEISQRLWAGRLLK